MGSSYKPPMNSEDYARHRREVEDRMLTWKCRVENPPRIITPTLTTANSFPNIVRASPITPRLEEKLPKIFNFENPSGGAGAPRRTPSGRLQTFLRGDPEIRFHQRDSSIFERSIRYQFDKQAIQKYKADLDKQVAEKRKPFSPIKHSETTDLASIMTAKNTYSIIRRWESLPKLNSTDVTRAYVMSPRTPDPLEYKRDLENQLETKRKLQEQFSNHEKYLSKLHFNSFNNFWGKPGGGAPKTSKRKENLFKLLHNTR